MRGRDRKQRVAVGGERAAISVPISVLAPARLSITTDCPMLSVSFLPIRRDTVSAGPPAESGTMRRIGRDGYGPSAALAADTATAQMRETHPPHAVRMVSRSSSVKIGIPLL